MDTLQTSLKTVKEIYNNLQDFLCKNGKQLIYDCVKLKFPQIVILLT